MTADPAADATDLLATAVYRAPMRARTRPDVPAGAGADFGLARGLVGIGEGLARRPSDLREAVREAAQVHGAKASRMLCAFAELPEGTPVWTRDSAGMFALGRIAGPWTYIDDPAATAVGIHHIRPAVWLEVDLPIDEIPNGVATAFARGGLNLQRIRDKDTERRTALLWAARTGGQRRG